MCVCVCVCVSVLSMYAPVQVCDVENRALICTRRGCWNICSSEQQSICVHIVLQAAMLVQKINFTDKLCVLERGEWDAWMRARVHAFVCVCVCVCVCKDLYFKSIISHWAMTEHSM